MKRTTIMADEELLYKIDRLAREQGQSKAHVIREALVEYVAKCEVEKPQKNPLLGLIGLAAEAAVEMDLADGKDEEMIRASMHPLYGFTSGRNGNSD